MDAGPDPCAPVRSLIALLDVEEIDSDVYRGARQPEGVGRVFGGQVIAQALQAAQRSVAAPKVAHSLHAYFMRPGDEALPITYRVERDFEGRSFATRRVLAMQSERPILTLSASFQMPEDGLSHQATMPDVPAPEDLRSERDLRAEMADRIPAKFQRLMLRARPIEIRPVSPRNWLVPDKRPPEQASWFRLVAPVTGASDSAAMHRSILAYASDMTLLGTCTLPHGVNWTTHALQTASLDHAIWLHEDFRVDDWLLYATDSPWAGHGRGFNRGSIFTRDGRLVATVAQEGLIRLRDASGSHPG
ncbi:MAG TPA: acyl-CoA thioesterase II [Sphingomonas sp.]|jgi:acyl-CoA thioesterase-2|nr:acyl-CoA thioesterase II [Sphingomonas sp.]